MNGYERAQRSYDNALPADNDPCDRCTGNHGRRTCAGCPVDEADKAAESIGVMLKDFIAGSALAEANSAIDRLEEARDRLLAQTE